MTDRKHAVELTAQQAEDIFDCINAATLYYMNEVDRLKQVVGVYDMSISVVDMLAVKERMFHMTGQRWVEFYQNISKIRAAERAAKEGGAA